MICLFVFGLRGKKYIYLGVALKRGMDRSAVIRTYGSHGLRDPCDPYLWNTCDPYLWKVIYVKRDGHPIMDACLLGPAIVTAATCYYSCCDCYHYDYSNNNYNYYILLLRWLLPYYLLVDSGSKARNAGTRGPGTYHNNIFFNIEHNVGMCWQGHACGSGMDRAAIPFGDS